MGKWAGDRLIITGDYSDYSPFPPHGEWKHGDLFKLADSFSDNHVDEAFQYYRSRRESIIKRLQKLYEGQLHMVVSLDKKEYIDPRAVNNHTNVADFFH